MVSGGAKKGGMKRGESEPKGVMSKVRVLAPLGM